MRKKASAVLVNVLNLIISLSLIRYCLILTKSKEISAGHAVVLIFAIVFITILVFINTSLEVKQEEENKNDEIKLFKEAENNEIKVEPLDNSEELESIKNDFEFMAKLRGEEIIIYSIKKKPENIYHRPVEYDKLRVGSLKKYYKIL